MTTAKVTLSVIMPVYNEEDAILPAIEDVRVNVLNVVADAELVVVNDGSRDRTGALVNEAAAQDARVRVIHKPNGGHGSALLAGLDAAEGEYIFLVDSDRQIPLDDFRVAWSHVVEGQDAVFGVRRRRHDPALRLYLSALIRYSVNVLFRVQLYDPNVPYKLFRRAIWNEARECVPDGTLAPSLFLAIVAKSRGYNIVEVDVTHRERNTGEMSLRRLKLLKFCAQGMTQMLALRRRVL
ncbi:MAG TPA: glycosyltransferase family 2 protein [Vicinamibacterales bacterium]|nr:glycosyltransferase family 2 protein [Vicinamibacterales bacterium]